MLKFELHLIVKFYFFSYNSLIITPKGYIFSHIKINATLVAFIMLLQN